MLERDTGRVTSAGPWPTQDACAARWEKPHPPGGSSYVLSACWSFRTNLWVPLVIAGPTSNHTSLRDDHEGSEIKTIF